MALGFPSKSLLHTNFQKGNYNTSLLSTYFVNNVENSSCISC